MNSFSLRSRPAPLVGRLHEITVLRDQYQAVRDGRGSVILVNGEAGIGKSRLVAEVRRWAMSDRIPYFEGACFEPDRSLPYALVLDLLQRYRTRQPDDPAARDLARLLPSLGTAEPAAVSLSDAPSHERQRVGYALRHFVTRQATGGPLLIILEDLHWADDASLDSAEQLARVTAELPVLLLATYRHDEVDRGLRHLLATLDRLRLATELRLAPLSRSDAEQLMRTLADQSNGPRGRVTQAIYELTDGNPFFIEEVLRALLDQRDPQAGDTDLLTSLRIPHSVHDVVLRRTASLSRGAETLLHQAAVAGREFDLDVLQALTSRDEGELIAALRELVEAQLVVEVSAERFSFRHALTRQAIYRSLLSIERRAVHRTIGEAKERLAAGQTQLQFADLSYHFAAAEVWEKALEYGTRAGQQALEMGAPWAAIDHFDRAMEAARQLARPVDTALCLDRARALALVGEFQAAQHDCLAALAQARSAEDRAGEWRALLDLGHLWTGYDYAEAGRYFEQALALARTLDRLPALAASLTHIGIWYLNTERIERAERSLEAALAIFEQLDDRAGIARVIDLLGTISDIGGDIPRMRRRYERALSLFRDLNDRQGMASTLSTMLLHGGSWVFETAVVSPHISTETIRAEASEALELARAIDWRAGEAYALVCTALALGSRGFYTLALDHATRALSIAREIAHHEWMTGAHFTLGMLRAELLDFAGAREALVLAYEEARTSGSLYLLYVSLAHLAETEIRLGHSAEADDLLASVDADLPMQTISQRRIWVTRAHLASARCAHAEALAIIERLFATAHNFNTIADIPHLALQQGQILRSLNRLEEASESLHAALHGARERQIRPLIWRIWQALGQLHADQGQERAAADAFRSAREMIEELAVEVSDAGMRSTFIARALDQLPAGRSRLARRSSPLTRRERDVAELVAQGLSNRAIAEQLSIGERTVETHVSNVLAKLGFHSRAQIVAWVTSRTRTHEPPYRLTPNSVLDQPNIP